MNIKSFVFNPFYENTYVVHSSQKNAYIFDPGCYEPFELNELTDYIQRESLTIKAVINTHCHIDHVLGNHAIKSMYEAPLWIPKNEKVVFDAVVAYAPQWGINGYEPASIDRFLLESDRLVLDEIEFEILEVPGHSPGHHMFYERAKELIVGGDVLFKESIGRTDLPGGNHEDLIRNIKEKVYTLPEQVTIYPGHGPKTTVGYEKRHNPFVKG
ncbi:MAG: MBL fold metallo-hydrolase [Bacteroidota bacterium]